MAQIHFPSHNLREVATSGRTQPPAETSQAPVGDGYAGSSETSGLPPAPQMTPAASASGPAVPVLSAQAQQLASKLAQALAGSAGLALSQGSSGGCRVEANFNTQPTVRDFGRMLVRIKSMEGNDARRSGAGQDVQHHYQADVLTGMNGSPLYSSPTVNGLRSVFQQSGEGNWKTFSKLEPAGYFNRFLSVVQTDGGEVNGSQRLKHSLVTLDSSSQEQVHLKDLLKPADFMSVVAQVGAALARPEGADYRLPADKLMAQINDSFSMHSESDGTLKASILLNSNREPGKVAELTFVLPDYVDSQI